MKFSKKTRIIIIVIALIVVAGAVFASLYLFTDMFKTPQDLFFKYIGKAAMPENSYSYQEMLDDIQLASTKSYKASYNIGIEGKTDSYYSSSNDIAKEVSKMKIGVDVQSIPSQEKASYDVSLKYDDASIASAQLVRNGDLYGIKSDLLDEKYIAIRNENLKNLAEKFGIDSTYIPDEIAFMDLYKLLYVSKEDQDHIINTYKDAIVKAFPQENFSKADNVTTTVNGTSKTATAYTLSITERDFYSAIINILQVAKNDDRTLDLLAEKLNTFVNESFFVNMGVTNITAEMDRYGNVSGMEIPKLSKEFFKEAIDNAIEELQYQMRYANTTAKINLIVYVENGNTIRLELKAGNEVEAAVDFYEENNKKHIALYGAAPSYDVMSYSYTTRLAKAMEIEYQTTKNGNYKNLDMGMTLYDQTGDKVGKVSFVITSDGKKGEGTNTETIKYTIETDEMTVTINLDGKIEYTDNLSIDTLTKANANIINDMSRGEIEKLVNKIAETVQSKGQDLSKKLEDIFTSSLRRSYTYQETLPSSIFDL